MGLHSRNYWKEGDDGSAGLGRGGMPSLGHVVKYLVIINVVVFVLQIFLDRPGSGLLSSTLGVTFNAWWQPWRYLTFQFLHADPMHILFNMLGLWFLGAPLERLWGGKKFLAFYLTCGAMAGVSYIALIGFLMHGMGGNVPLIGASGGVYGLILAAAVLMPHVQLIFLFFPVPIRLAAAIIFALMIGAILYGIGRGAEANTFSQSAHFGGVVMGAVWLFAGPAVGRARERSIRVHPSRGRWQRRMAKLQAEQNEVDRILLKIAHEGINSLSRHEKKVLHDATKHQKEQEQELHRL